MTAVRRRVVPWYSTFRAGLPITIAVPFANGESTGFSEEGSYTRAGSWVMEVGTSSAHIMIPDR